MRKLIFSKENIEKLNQNIYVKPVSNKSIRYSNEFKIMFIEEYLKGKIPRDIFSDAEFKIEVLGKKYYEQVVARWMRSYRKDGIVGSRDTRRDNIGGPSTKPLLKANIINKQEAKIKLTNSGIYKMILKVM